MDKKLFNEYKKIIVKINKLANKSRGLEEQLQEIREKLKDNCSHPSEYIHSFFWEHDNGYGKQSQVEGARCSICLAERHWSSSDHWTAEEDVLYD